MRVFVLATVLLASSSLYPSFAQEEGKAPVAAPQTGVPTQTDQKSQQQQDQRTGRDQPRADDREVGRDWMMHRGDGDRMGRDDRDMGRDWRMHRDREMGGDRDMDRGRYRERGDRDWDRADQDRDNRGYSDEDRPRHRVKVCVEYENGDEYCRYKERR
jgi:hypothetical protein